MDAIFWSNLRVFLMQHIRHPYSAFMGTFFEILVKVERYYKLITTLLWWSHLSALKAPVAMLLGQLEGPGSPR